MKRNVAVQTIDDPFVADPVREPRLRTITARPCHAETPESGPAESLTPKSVFYVRNHMSVPAVEEPEQRLTIELSEGEKKSYLKDLKGAIHQTQDRSHAAVCWKPAESYDGPRKTDKRSAVDSRRYLKC
jgi:hypothetical protein